MTNLNDLTTSEYYEKTLQVFGYEYADMLRMLVGINGFNHETINDFIYYRSGYHDLDQYIECEKIEID